MFPFRQPGTSSWKESWIQCPVESVVPTLCCQEGRGHVGTGGSVPGPSVGWLGGRDLTHQWARGRKEAEVGPLSCPREWSPRASVWAASRLGSRGLRAGGGLAGAGLGGHGC